MITAENITDEQIRELQTMARTAPFDGNDLTTVWCSIALGEKHGDRGKARARCAEIINARAMPAMSCGCPIDAHSDTVNVGMGPGTGTTCGRGWPLAGGVK